MPLFSRKTTDVPRRRQDGGFRNEPRTAQDDFEERYSFRRNRTLTGSSSSLISAPGESNAQIKSPRVQVHELTRHRRHLGLVLFAVLMSAWILYILLSQFTASVSVRAADISTRLTSGYDKIIEDYLATEPLERLRFMINEKQLSDYVGARAPEVVAVSVEGSSGFGKSNFVLTLRRPLVGWSINGKQEYVDSSGTPFSRNYYQEPTVQVVDKSGIQVQPGKAIASNRFLSFVGRSVAYAKDKEGLTVTQVIIPEGTTRQIELRLRGVKYPIKLSIDRGVGEQIEDMARAITWLHTHGKKPRYLDVRVSGEAFYR